VPSLALAEAAVYQVDPVHSTVGFTIRHFVSNVSGNFRDFDGMVHYDKAQLAAAKVELTVRAASIDTANGDRDNHLRSPDFFEVEKFPALSFTSTSVKPLDADTLEVTGDLTIHGVTQRVTMPIEVLGTLRTPNGEKAGFETGFTLDRKDYGIVWNRALDAGGTVLGDDVKVYIAIEANRQQPAAAGK
jgi:polyisoprenoid-binding protein YceI